MPSRPPCALAHLEVDPHRQHRRGPHALGRAERVVLAGHIDTVPLTTDPANLPTRRVRAGRAARCCGAGGRWT